MSSFCGSDIRMIDGPQGSPRSVRVTAEELLRILDEVGIAGWNSWVGLMYDQNLICPVWTEGEPPPEWVIDLDFSDGDFLGMNLDGIDLRFADLRRASFHRTSLRRARFDVCDISGTNFTGAQLQGATFECAFYKTDEPPRGLPTEFLRQCEAYDDNNE